MILKNFGILCSILLIYILYTLGFIIFLNKYYTNINNIHISRSIPSEYITLDIMKKYSLSNLNIIENHHEKRIQSIFPLSIECIKSQNNILYIDMLYKTYYKKKIITKKSLFIFKGYFRGIQISQLYAVLDKKDIT